MSRALKTICRTSSSERKFAGPARKQISSRKHQTSGVSSLAPAMRDILKALFQAVEPRYIPSSCRPAAKFICSAYDILRIISRQASHGWEGNSELYFLRFIHIYSSEVVISGKYFQNPKNALTIIICDILITVNK